MVNGKQVCRYQDVSKESQTRGINFFARDLCAISQTCNWPMAISSQSWLVQTAQIMSPFAVMIVNHDQAHLFVLT